MSKTIAVLDLGTNTFHLMIAEREGGEMNVLKKLQIPVMLGEGGINKNLIAKAACQRGISALEAFAEELKKFAPCTVKVAGTSAIREADNGQEFMEEAYQRTGIMITTISGEEEAAYICEGVRHSLPFEEKPYLLMDIGGGSVEFIIANKDHTLWMHSFRLGAARLIETYHEQDPMGPEEREALYNYLLQELQPLTEALKEYECAALVGSAGSFESFVELVESELNKKVRQHSPHSYELSLADYQKIHSLLIHSTHEQRTQMKGLVSFRVEMIVVATCLLDFVLKHSGIKTFYVSDYALKEGMIFSG